jgi:HYR domain
VPTSRLQRAFILATVASLILAAVTFADVTVPDGDNATPVAANPLAIGTVCVNSTTSRGVLIAIKHTGTGTNTFADGAEVTVTVLSASGTGLSAVMDDTPATITLPVDWTDTSNNTLSDTVSSTVTFVAGASPGSFSGTINYRARGLNDAAPSVLINRDAALTVSATVSNTGVCAPTSDSTAPTTTITLVPTTPNGGNGWYTSDVTVTVSATDPDDAVVETRCVLDPSAVPTSFADLPASCGYTGAGASVTTDGEHTVYAASKDSNGNVESPIVSSSFKIDETPPEVSCQAASFILNQSPAEVSATVTDVLSGPTASPISAPADTTSVGSKSVSLTGYDKAGNSTTASCAYTVGYNFNGLFAPVDRPNTLNVSKAGQAIPLKWRLTDYYGNPVTTLTSVKVVSGSLSCTASTTADAIEEYATGSSGLQNLGDGYYQFNWKTPTSYANSCRTIGLDLGEGSVRSNLAFFTFKK